MVAMYCLIRSVYVFVVLSYLSTVQSIDWFLFYFSHVSIHYCTTRKKNDKRPIDMAFDQFILFIHSFISTRQNCFVYQAATASCIFAHVLEHHPIKFTFNLTSIQRPLSILLGNELFLFETMVLFN